MCELHRKLQAVNHGKTDIDSQEFEFLVDYVGWKLLMASGERQGNAVFVP